MFWLNSPKSKISEKEIIDEYNRTSFRSISIGVIFGMLFFNGFAIYDYFAFPDNFMRHTAIRLLLVTPYCIGALFLLRKLRYRPYTRQIILSGALLISICTIYFYTQNYSDMKSGAPAGLVFLFMYILTSMRLLRREALIFVAVTISSVIVALINSKAGSAAWFSFLFHSGIACALGLVACHTIEHSWRKMLEQRKIAEQHELEAAALLSSIFPMSIASRLRKSSAAIAERFDNSTILFADIQGFTTISSQLSPYALVHDLDVVFSRIDNLCAQHGCEKIKTIGDAYLAVAGVPTPVSDHAQRIVRLALAMQRLSTELTLGGQPITFRIGIHSGPVVAGVIGKSRFAYDLWGDSVNMASRMESVAPPGAIQISSDTAGLVRDAFVLEPRGKITIKGKGEVTTWLVMGEAVQRAAHYLEDEKKSA
jgi:class 3 adenylate cyclase